MTDPRSTEGVPIAVPTVDPVGIVHRPDGWESATGSRGRRQRTGVLVVASWFGLAAVATSVLSLGAYCLTSDGADRRALDRARSGPSASGSGGESPVAAGPACPTPPPSPTRKVLAMIGTRIASLAGAETPPIDRRHPALVETATFALG